MYVYIYIQIFTYSYVYVFICRAIVVGMSECSCFHTTFGGKLPGALPAFVYRRFLKRPIRGVLLVACHHSSKNSSCASRAKFCKAALTSSSQSSEMAGAPGRKRPPNPQNPREGYVSKAIQVCH